jgi:hypothetical protein
MVRIARLIGDDAHLLPDDEAAVVLLVLDGFLQHHDGVAGLVVGGEEFVRVMYLVDLAPAATQVRLKIRREAHVGEELLPVERVDEVAHGFGVVRGGCCLVGKMTVRGTGMPMRAASA